MRGSLVARVCTSCHDTRLCIAVGNGGPRTPRRLRDKTLFLAARRALLEHHHRISPRDRLARGRRMDTARAMVLPHLRAHIHLPAMCVIQQPNATLDSR